MVDFKKIILSTHATVTEALKLISEVAIPNMALFIVNDNNQLVGSLTDGDIRRGLLQDKTINNPIVDFINTNSKYFLKGENNYEKALIYKKAGIRFVPVLNNKKEIVEILDLDTIRSLLPVDVVLMAGGKGERLKPLTDTTPKPMLKVGDKPIIVRNIERLRAYYGINTIHITVRHMADQIINGLKQNKSVSDNINFIIEPEPLGTIGAVRLINSFSYDTVLLMNSDLLTNIDFQDFYQNFIDSKADMLVATVPYYVDVPYAIMDINDKSEVKSFNEKPRYTYYSNAGIYLFKKELINLIPENKSFDATHFMEAVISNNKKLVSYPILGYWLDIGRIEDFYKAQEDVKYLNF